MNKYYIADLIKKDIKTMKFDNDKDAFKYTQSLNKNKGNNYKAYDERENLIYGVCQHGAVTVNK